MIKVACCGNGLDSAGALLMNSDYDIIIHSVTGADLPETFQTMKDIEKKTGKKIHLCYPKEGKIQDYYYEKKVIPWISKRDCPDKFKKRPQRRELNKLFPGEKFEFNIFYSYDEADRIKTSDRSKKGRVTWHTRKYLFRYPLVEARITRQDLEEFCEKILGYVPDKSGCFMCPAMSKDRKIELALNKPELFLQASKMYRESKLRKYKDFESMIGETRCQCF